MKVFDGQRIPGALVFHDIPAPEYGGDVFLDNHVFLFLDDDQVDSQGFPGQGMFDVEVQDIGVGDKVHTDSVTEGGMPGDTLVGEGGGGGSWVLLIEVSPR
jgi:hypothetical protein